MQASVQLPKSVLETVADEIDRVQFTMFQDTTFFEVGRVQTKCNNQGKVKPAKRNNTLHINVMNENPHTIQLQQQ